MHGCGILLIQEKRLFIMNRKEIARNIGKIFDKVYQDADCSLEYKTPLQLLISTILAAQCTDARVNIVTKTLYKKYKNVYDFANADLEELQEDIKSTGFYRNKAKNIIMCCQSLIENHNGEVPASMEQLLLLPGVGRKTANLVLNDVFGIPGVVVDTHAKRLAKRMGLTEHEDPEKVEKDLMECLPEENWGKFCHQLVFHGRAICTARNPKCHDCPVNSYCITGKKSLDI